jgi:hypothetical protein
MTVFAMAGVACASNTMQPSSPTITPEFGPAPYTQTMPFSGEPLSNAWDQNVAMLHLLRGRYAAH